MWCELCKEKVNLELNNPPFSFTLNENCKLDTSEETSQLDTKATVNNPFSSLKESFEQNVNDSLDSSSLIVDDYELISYLDQENSNYYQRFLYFLNRKIFKLYPHQVTEESEHDEYTFNKNLKLPRNGLIGLDNLGNTCYMSSALQALSNCYAFSSYFLECSDYVSHLSALKSQQLKNSDAFNMSIAVNYMKLMRELWRGRKYSLNKSGSVVGEVQSFTPSEMVHAIKLNNPMFRGYMQHDSQELLIYLMDQLHEELKRPLDIAPKKADKSQSLLNKRNERDNENTSSEMQENDHSMSSHYENEDDEDEITVKILTQFNLGASLNHTNDKF